MWDLVSFVQGRMRRVCLEQLAAGPRTPGMIAKATGEHLTHVSRALRELSGKGLVECLTPKMSKNRYYRMTEKGRKVMAMGRKAD